MTFDYRHQLIIAEMSFLKDKLESCDKIQFIEISLFKKWQS